MLWCLHGFLGRGADWNPLARHLRTAGLGPVAAPNLFAPGAGVSPLPRWVESFTAGIRGQASAPPHCLLGYSLGARLALHLLLDDPARWQAGVLVAPGLGFAEPEARQARRERDEAWACRFTAEPWEELVQAWEAQPLFKGRPGPGRREEDYERALLAKALRRWSSGVQEYLLPRLAELGLPLLWVVGEEDIRYVHQAREAIEALPQGELWIVPGAAHRVPWEAADEFNRRVESFLRPYLQDGEHEQ